MISPSQIWLIPALPLLAAAIGALTPRGGKRRSAGVAIAAMVLSFGLSVAALITALGLDAGTAGPTATGGIMGEVATHNFTWFALGVDAVQLGWLLDPLSAFMCVMVTFVGALIFIFSLGYMREDPNFTRFFCFLSLFAAAMLGLLVANSLLLLFVCWEIVGLASYLLIGFWFHKPEAAAAAKKAFITTRIGDLGLLLGMVWLYHATGTLLFYDNGAGVLEGDVLLGLVEQFTVGGLAVSTAIGLLIFCGAIGKSGQFPLHVWLPDAMEGPTPVSALIHAATMVAAGVFLMARVYPLLVADMLVTDLPVHALGVVAVIGAITALLGALIAIGQSDIKRVLAYSTVSQLGYMMLAIGVGSWTAAIFHLLTHAFFKALLFLGAGSVIAAAHHEQDIRRLGGLASRMRVTFLTFAIGMLALAGVPLLFSGFWSKEAILHAAHEIPEAWAEAGFYSVGHFPYYAALAGVGLTAFYMTRLVAETFLGSPRSDAASHAHENSAVMTLPLALLALGAIGLGFINTPMGPWLDSSLGVSALTWPIGDWLRENFTLMATSSGLVFGGIAVGWLIYGRRPRPDAGAADPLARALPRAFGFLEARMRFDEGYAATAGALSRFAAALADALDRWVWGGMVTFLGAFGRFSGFIGRETDEGGLNAGFDRTGAGLRGSGRFYSRRQSGEAHGYLRMLALGFVLLALILIAGGGW